MGMTTGKIAVSMPADVLDALERARSRSGRTRSAIVTDAVRQWLRSGALSERDKRYVEAYLREPERTDEIAAIAAGAVAVWEPWQ